MEYKLIKLEIENKLATITLNHPEVLNAVSPPMLAELKDAVYHVSLKDSGARCLLITGAGRGFCAGANLTAGRRAEGQTQNPTSGISLDETYNPFFFTLRDLRMPIVTAVNGPAAGVGMSIALMGDMVLAARSAYFLQAFKRIGLIPDGGATYLLPRILGKARAMELSLLAENLPAEKALEWGLINRVYDDDKLMGEAVALATGLANGPTVALSLMRRAFWSSMDNTYEEQMRVESVYQTEAGQSKDATEGAMAFIQKRPAKFTGE